MSTASDNVVYTYDRQGGLVGRRDGNGTVHGYVRDKLGRVVQDCVTTLGTGVDGTVLRVGTSYDPRGLVSKVSSYDNATPGSGSVVNEVGLSYDSFGNLSADAQSHSGAVDGSTPTVGYAYANGSANTVRRTSMTYPGGKQLDFDYGSSGSITDRLSLLASVTQTGESDAAVAFTWVGAGRLALMSFAEPALELRYKALAGEPVGDAGDPYVGYDRFGRSVDMRWWQTEAEADRSRIQYGYDRASRRLWRQELVAPDTAGQDNAWNYDGLGQVLQGARGLMNINRTAIGGVPAEEENFVYDPVGNWQNYEREADGEVTLDQGRRSNEDNQLVQLNGVSVGLSFDLSGNATAVKPDHSGDWSAGYKLAWDAWNRLVSVANAGDDSAVASYAYDGMSRRVTSLVGGDTRHCYYDDNWKAVEERLDDATTPERVYVWSSRPGHRDELVRRERDTDGNGSLDERFYCLMDYYDPVALSDTSGAVQERYGFTSFGLARFMAADFSDRSTTSYGWNFLFHGQFRDEETGWDNYGYRYYLPWLGRWPSRDPIGESGGSNLYLFSDNRPICSIDYLGTATVEDPNPPLLSGWKSKATIHVRWKGLPWRSCDITSVSGTATGGTRSEAQAAAEAVARGKIPCQCMEDSNRGIDHDNHHLQTPQPLYKDWNPNEGIPRDIA